MHELQSGLQQIMLQATNASREDLDAALQRLEELVSNLPLLPAALLAVGCGALIEQGGRIDEVAPAIFQRTYDALQLAAPFVRACQDAARTRPTETSDPEDAELCVEAYGEQVGTQMPEEAQAWSALEMLCNAALAILMHDARMRQVIGTYEPFTTALQAFPVQNSTIECIRKLLQILENEELIVLHPALRRGYRVRISGLGDNFQLHTLLADALIGDTAQGWLPGNRPNPIVVAAAKDGPCPHTVEENRKFPIAQGVFNLWNWQGLQPDGTLPTGDTASHYWIWNEGTPADIATYEGTRVILLGPPPYNRTWSAGRYFPFIPGQLEVLEVLTQDRTKDWLARLAATPKPEA
ncbi:hypothetical protein EPA93_32205 [Ktedonosporobacter rubrisoli]|uniref:Uncharacterized protein n=1 Tax=Ktedonosporobacter rubrisoli TaxID=2509675 RepID=A0A4P6JZ74_KTERU|nr:hypothetical protein [Ktedonosporobacter rubrisoli]QBD80386.1 hypothetical protein EPA93_32205 [Ktedonosporobacter rubrisoli]